MENSTGELQEFSISLPETLENIKFNAKVWDISSVENPLFSVEKMGITWGEEIALWGKNWTA